MANLTNTQSIAISEINRLARKIQANIRIYYWSRVIEFLTDIVREDFDSNIRRLIDYVDTDDKEFYTKLFNQ